MIWEPLEFAEKVINTDKHDKRGAHGLENESNEWRIACS